MAHRMFDTLFIRNPDSLGDILVANGLFHHFIEKANQVVMGVNDVFHETTKCLYHDFSKVHVVTLDYFYNLKQTTPDSYILPAPKLSMSPVQYGDGTHGGVFLCWDKQYYDSFDLPFSLRYRNFKMPRYIEGAQELKDKLTEGEKDYIIVNKYMGGEENYIPYFVEQFNPHKYKVIEIHPKTTNNALHYVELFKHAKQIHVLPTSFHHLVESMITDVQGDLYFHNARRNFYSVVNTYWNDHRWNIINYLDKW